MTPERYQRIVELFEGAAGRSPEDRAAFLAQACAGDAGLRREVEAMLAADEQPGGMLEKPPEDLAAGVLAARDPAPGPLSPSTHLGPYEIVGPLGAGGMGEVYRARDARLRREVAIKVLPERFADSLERLRRFEGEARAAGMLNHPNVLTVYDVGTEGRRPYLVTELLEGQTVRERLAGGPLPRRKAIEYARQIAEGLASAHEKNITHRDLKPENLFLTTDGRVKILDFGLAKLAEPESHSAVTLSGAILGTIGYMSPEQAAGCPVDHRSDIFSFGVVLYEMLSGRRAFQKPTGPETMAAILREEPAMLAEVPAGVQRVVTHCLEKEPGERFQSARDLAFALASLSESGERMEMEESLAGPEGGRAPAPDRCQSMREMGVGLRRLTRQSAETLAPGRPHRVRGFKWAAVAAPIVLALVSGALIVFRLQQPAGPVRLEYTQLTSFADSATSPALSPDGRMLAFIRGPETFAGPGEIYVKLLPDGDAAPLTHDGLIKMSPAFAPGGARIVYTVKTGGAGDTWSVPVLGGEPTRMLASAEALSFVESAAGPPRVLFSEPGAGAYLSIVTSAQNRSDARTVYSPPGIDGMAHRSYISPDRKWVLVVEMDGAWLPCRLVPFEGKAPAKPVGPSPGQCTTAAWSPDGQWMYFSANIGSGYHIWRQRFPDGAPEQVTSGASEEEGIAFAPDGRSFVTSVGSRQSTLWVHDARGERQITSQGFASLPLFSADGKKLYYLLRSRASRRFVSGELWASNLETGQNQRLLPDFLMEHYSVSPDGNRIVFAAVGDTGHSAWLATLDGRSAPRRLSTIDAFRTFFGANGDVFFLGAEDQTRKFIYRVREDGGGLQKAIPDPVAYFYDVSPDTKLLAVLAGMDIRVYPADGGSPAAVCSRCGAAGGENRGITPPAVSWSPDGKFLYLNDRAKHQIYAVPLQPGRSLPPLPASGLGSLAEAADWPGVRIIREPLAFAGPNPSVYAFPRVTTQRNIYRVSVP